MCQFTAFTSPGRTTDKKTVLNSTGLIVGITVGILCILSLVSLFWACNCRKNKKRQEKNKIRDGKYYKRMFEIMNYRLRTIWQGLLFSFIV